MTDKVAHFGVCYIITNLVVLGLTAHVDVYLLAFVIVTIIGAVREFSGNRDWWDMLANWLGSLACILSWVIL